MEKISKMPCEKCGKEVWESWQSCPECGYVLPAGKVRSQVHLRNLRGQ